MVNDAGLGLEGWAGLGYVCYKKDIESTGMAWMGSITHIGLGSGGWVIDYLRSAIKRSLNHLQAIWWIVDFGLKSHSTNRRFSINIVFGKRGD